MSFWKSGIYHGPSTQASALQFWNRVGSLGEQSQYPIHISQTQGKWHEDEHCKSQSLPSVCISRVSFVCHLFLLMNTIGENNKWLKCLPLEEDCTQWKIHYFIIELKKKERWWWLGCLWCLSLFHKCKSFTIKECRLLSAKYTCHVQGKRDAVKEVLHVLKRLWGHSSEWEHISMWTFFFLCAILSRREKKISMLIFPDVQRQSGCREISYSRPILVNMTWSLCVAG